MAAPRQMTKDTLNALKGWPNMAAVDFYTEFSPDIPEERLPVRAGSVVHLNSAGKYELGVGTDSVMPLFTFHNSDDPNVVNDGGDPANDKGAWIGFNGGQALSLVGIGAYELVSTQYVSDDYAPNDPLTSDKTGSNAGKLKLGTLYTDMVVGIVSRGVVDNGWGYSAVAFWPFPVFPTP